MKDTVTFGIVGCGIIARYHALAIRENSGARLLGAYSRTPASAEAFSKEFDVPVYDSYEALLAAPELDAVVICTSSGAHFEQARQALLASKHVVVEKPMCLTMADANELVRLAKELGLMVCVISQTRFSAAAQAIRGTIESGGFGKLVSASLTMRYQRTQAYYDSADWRGTVTGDGGGVLMNQGIHGIDLLCYFMGEPVSVTGYARTLLRDIEVEDTAAAAVAFENGSVAVIDATVCSDPAFGRKIVLCGEKGTAVLEEDAITLWSLPTPCPIPLGGGSGDSGAADPTGISHLYHAREYENIVAHLLQDAPLLIDAHQGRIPLSVILGLYEASEKGCAIKI